MFEGLMNWFSQPSNVNSFTNYAGQIGAAISPQSSWQQNLGNIMANYSQMQQYNNAMNKQNIGQSGAPASAPTPASITVKYPQAPGTTGSQMDAGASAAPTSGLNTGSVQGNNPIVPQGTGLPMNNPSGQTPQQQSLGPMNLGSMMGNYSNLPFLLALRR